MTVKQLKSYIARIPSAWDECKVSWVDFSGHDAGILVGCDSYDSISISGGSPGQYSDRVRYIGPEEEA